MNSNPPASPENDPNLSDLGRAMLGGDSGASRPSSKPSAVWEPPTADELHKLLPQYEIVKMLGRGGMGAVYMGRQISLDRPVAIKILSAALEDADVGFSERFKNEARAMAKLNHPGIVSVYDFGETDGGLLYIVMEYVDGTDVARMIAANGRLHTEHAMAITAHVCDALAYAHERGIIHRDIKPANIMVGYDGNVKVADFGLAKVSTSNGSTIGLTQSGMAMGTLHFMAPEALVLGSSVDHRADIYAVGVMLYQMLTGKLPHGMFELPSIQVKGLDPRYDGIIAKSMREDREVRYQAASELRRDLDAILTQPVVKVEAPSNAAPPQVGAAKLPTGARPKRPMGQPYRPPQGSSSTLSRPAPQKSHAGLWVAVTLLLAGGVGAWFFLQNRKAQTIVPTTGTPSESRSGCAVTLRTPDADRVLSLEKGQPRLYDSDPLRVIEEMDPLLKGWQFTSIPQRIDNEYEVSVSQSGTLIAFGGLHKGFTKEDVFGKDSPQWQTDDQAIKGTMIKMCYRREVKAGDTFRMKAFELQLAAAKIVIEKSAPAVSAIPPVTPQPVSPAPVPPQTLPKPTMSSPTPTTPTLESKTVLREGDWQPLFPSDSLAGWTGDLSSFQIRNGVLIGGGGNLAYPREYGDFSLKFDLRLAAGAYVEMSIRGQNPPQPSRGAPNASFGIVFRDSTEIAASTLEQWQRHGAIYGYQEAMRVEGGAPGIWSENEIRLENQHLTVTINGVTVQDTDLRSLARKAPGGRSLDLSRNGGQLAILGFKGTTELRNLRIKELGGSIQKDAPAASPTLWIDAKGRSLQAKFVRLEGTAVLLNIAGKVTPVAMNTLSTASQDIARQLSASAASEASATPSGAGWLEGRWIQSDVPGPSENYIVDYLPGQIVMFKGGNVDGIGQWSIQGSTITNQWPRGHYDSTAFTLEPGARAMTATLTLRNQSPKQVHYTKLADAVPVPAPSDKELEGRLFDFGWISKANPSDSKLHLSTMRILPRGQFDVVKNANESSWDVRGDKLLIKDAGGNVTTTFDRCYKLNGHWLFVGDFHDNLGIHHILREQFEIPAAADQTEAGFIPLLDANQPGDWVQVGPGKLDIKDGVATTSSPSKWGVAIYAKRTFSNFVLKAEFKGLSSLFNSGLWLRIADLRDDIVKAADSRYEVGIVHSSGDQGRFTGSIWGVQPAKSNQVKADDWNELEVTVTGQRYVVKLNGQIVNDFTGNKGLSGYIGLEENFSGSVQFRNVRVKPLP